MLKDTCKKGTAKIKGSLGREQGHEKGTADTMGSSFLLPFPLSSHCTPGGGHVTAGGQVTRNQGPSPQ